jgi:YidC/Oxa1 family membrane protein insertase
MDKKSIIGLVLIGLILSVFTIVNQPTPEEKAKLAKEAAKREAKADVKAKVADVKEVKASKNATVKAKHVNPLVIEKGELVRLENEKLIVDFSTQGGKVAAVYLKEFQSYKDFAAKKSKKVPLKLFQDGDASNELVFPINGKDFRTGKLAFEVKKQTKNSIVLAVSPNEGQSIEYVYKLNKNAYDLDYTVNLKGFDGKVTPQNIELKWKTAFRKTERLFKSQRMVSTVCFNYDEKGLDYLSETADDFQEAEENIEWVAFKQSYFSSILRPEAGFGKSGSKFNVKTYKENDERIYSHLKDYTATVNLNVKNAGNASVKMNWYFGPNDFKVLKSYGKGYDDIINFGWGLFRWINMYAVEPIFSLFTNAGVGIGVAILLLTLVLKLILMPIQWKMYVSSAKMRILKPEIDELNAKFPEKEDAMKKQVEMMALYRESGASPLAGCIPMLIQMPILLAVFRFFPAAFEMRQQPFLWAEDLSSYDSIWDFGVSIWPYGDHMSLFTLLMAATTLVYTYLNSGNVQQPQQPGMPNMKVIMYIFPVMMIFIFNDYSAGLSYYYFISTLISILMMVAIKQFFVDEEKLKAKMAAKKLEKSTTVKKKSKFQERLEQMQKLQQEQKNARRK